MKSYLSLNPYPSQSLFHTSFINFFTKQFEINIHSIIFALAKKQKGWSGSSAG